MMHLISSDQVDLHQYRLILPGAPADLLTRSAVIDFINLKRCVKSAPEMALLKYISPVSKAWSVTGQTAATCSTGIGLVIARA
jgi:hypothetical protein